MGGALDEAFNSAGSLPGDLGAIYGLPSSQLPGALNSLSGELFASEHSVLIDQAFYSRQAVLARLRQFGYAESGGPQAALANVGPTSMSHLGGPDYVEAREGDQQKHSMAPSFPPSFGPSLRRLGRHRRQQQCFGRAR